MNFTKIEDSDDCLADLVYEQVLVLISNDSLKPGDRLIQEKIAKQMGLSRTPVREAMIRLEREGTIKSIPRKGFVVSTISTQDIRDIFGAREAIEGHASFLVAAAKTPEKIAAIEALVAKDPTGELINMEEAFAINKAIHRAIVAQANNELLLNFFDKIWSNPIVIRIFAATYTQEYRPRLTDHAPILDAIKFDTPEKAQSITLDHIRSGLDLHIESVS